MCADPGEDNSDDPLAGEREHLVHARRCLEAMREAVRTLTPQGGDPVSTEFLKAELFRRAQAMLDDPTTPLFFGRIDRGADVDEDGKERFYIGRRHVRDAQGDPVVVDWRADISRSFYQASASVPMGVTLRRRFGFSHGVLTSYEEEHLDRGEEHDPATSAILTTEIERPRVGPMRDIVATIQPEQDELVRTDLSNSVCIQGAPGTGKTAVGLHRAAYLLYAHRDQLRRTGVLVVGPNRSFLGYIGALLPALGELDVEQVSVADLPPVRARGADVPAVDRHWPAQSARSVVTRLLTDATFLERFANGLLNDDEQQALLNADPGAPIRWSLADAFLLDEASGLLKRPKTYGHVVVDEAQDLSSMQCRAIARRCPTGSTTVLGDLAQATAPAAVGDWAQSLRAMGQPDARVVELTRGYRVPAQILDFANQLLPALDVAVGGATSLRTAPDSLRLRRATDLHADVAAVLSEAAAREGSVGVICVDEDVTALRRAIMRAGIDSATVEQGMEAHVTLVPVTLCKGLEFDHVIVVEPARIADLARGLNWLYVALTRAVSTLTVVHTTPLPRALDARREQVELGHVS